MNIEKLRQEYIGKKLLTIISLDTKEDYIKTTLAQITKDEFNHDISNAKLLLFENNKALIFVDYDDDGYRSGDWFLIHLEKILDKEQTKEVKTINSTVRNIEFFKNATLCEYGDDDDDGVLITTDNYVIKMGQHNVSDYYPSNFFNIEECKSFALQDGTKGEIVDFYEEIK